MGRASAARHAGSTPLRTRTMISNTRLVKLQLIEEMDAVRLDGLAAGDEESLWAARIMTEEIAKLRRELAAEMAAEPLMSTG